MCDTFVALPATTADGSVILGKNSDREPNEAHELVVRPARDHGSDAMLRCTHVGIPQARRTRAVLLAKPYWIWGAEMGVNDAGVAIGNEALFNRGTREDTAGLIGMDLLRLGLERASSAAEAIGVMSELLGRHGQSGQAGHTHDFAYDNSFIAADAGEAWVLETMGREWVARRVTDVDSISNGLTTRTTWDRASVGVAVGTDVAERYVQPVLTRLAAAEYRRCRTRDSLLERTGGVRLSDAMGLLRDHGDRARTDPDWSPADGIIGQEVCMHAGFGPVRSSQSTGSLVAHLTPAGATVWATGTAAPCTSAFKPLWLDAGLPDLGPRPRGVFDPSTLWWRHEELHRATLADYPERHRVYAPARDELEASLLAGAPPPDAPAADRRAHTVAAFATVADAEQGWTHEVRRRPVGRGLPQTLRQAPYRRAWRAFDRASRFPDGRGF